MDRLFEMPQGFALVRNRLLNEFPNGGNGLNIKRVEDFIQQEGLQVKPYIIFNKSELPLVRNILDLSNYNKIRSFFNNGEQGLYIPEIDLALIVRNSNYEESNGVIYTEGLVAHELAHASSMYPGYVTKDNLAFYTPRIGFSLPYNQVPWGRLFEEGWADMHRAEYFLQNASVEEKYLLESALRPLGYDILEMTDTVPTNISDLESLPLPVKYLSAKPEGKPGFISAAYAGYALELFCKYAPEIKPLMVEGRSSIEGLRKLAQVFERISTGLYRNLQTGEYNMVSFSQKLSTVINITGGLENAIKANGKLRTYWDEYLASVK